MTMRRKVIEGLTWSGIAQAGRQGCQFVITTVLARILAPQEFGLIAMAGVFIGLATLFAEMGIGNALVQRKQIGEEHCSSAFWLNMALGTFAMLFSFMVSPAIAMFYQKPEIVPVINVLSVNFFISAAAVVQQSMLMRAMDFRSLMIRDLGAVILSGMAGIILALNDFGIWSLVFQTLSWGVLNNLFLWTFSSWRPRLLVSKKALTDLTGFSLNMTGFQIVNYFARNIDQLLIGRFLGAQLLGYYAMAYKLMLFPIQNIAWVISRVAFPAFSEIQEDLPRVAANYAKMIKYVSLVTFPMMLFFFIVAPELIHLLWGGGWDETIRIVRVLCFCGMIQSVVTVGGTVYLSQGRTDLQFRMSLVNIALTTISITAGLQRGILGVAQAYTLFNLLWAPVSIWMVTRILRCSFFKIIGILGHNLMAGLFAFVALTGLKQHLGCEPPVLIPTLLCAGGVIYLSALVVLKEA